MEMAVKEAFLAYFKGHPGDRLEGQSKTTNNLGQESCCPG